MTEGLHLMKSSFQGVGLQDLVQVICYLVHLIRSTIDTGHKLNFTEFFTNMTAMTIMLLSK